MSIRTDARHPDPRVQQRALVALERENDERKRETKALQERLVALEHLLAENAERADARRELGASRRSR